MRGRPPKPTALRILQGNPGRRPLNRNEPKPPKGAAMPEYLLKLPGAVKQWNLWAPILTECGILTQADARAFARLCRGWAQEEETAGMMDPDTGRPVGLDPRLCAELRQLESLLGCNPSARARLKSPPEKAKTALDKYRNA